MHLHPHGDNCGFHFFHEITEANGPLCALGDSNACDTRKRPALDICQQCRRTEAGDCREQNETARCQNFAQGRTFASQHFQISTEKICDTGGAASGA